MFACSQHLHLQRPIAVFVSVWYAMTQRGGQEKRNAYTTCESASGDSTNNNCNKLPSNCDVPNATTSNRLKQYFIHRTILSGFVPLCPFHLCRFSPCQNGKNVTMYCSCFNYHIEEEKKQKRRRRRSEIYAHSNAVFNSSSYSHVDGSNDWLAGKSRAKRALTHTDTHRMYRSWKYSVNGGTENLKHPKRK